MMFCGLIDQNSAQRIMHGVNVASQNNQHMHILFQSTGGIIGDGVCLYNYFKACPTGLTLYNAGTVSSVGVVAFLGAEQRIVSQYGTFMFHANTAPALAMTSSHLKAAADSLNLDDSRIKAILESRIAFSEQQWSALRHHELWFSSGDAVKGGIATSLGEFAPPRGAPVYTL